MQGTYLLFTKTLEIYVFGSTEATALWTVWIQFHYFDLKKSTDPEMYGIIKQTLMTFKNSEKLVGTKLGSCLDFMDKGGSVL